MAPRVRPAATTLEVQVMFEPSRVAAACLADAYGRVVPVHRRPVRAMPRPSVRPGVARLRPGGGTVR